MEQTDTGKYQQKLRNAIREWEDYEDSKQISPVLSLVDLVCDPQTAERDKLLKTVLEVLSRVINENMTYKNNITSGQNEYIRMLFPENGTIYCRGKYGLMRFITAFLGEKGDMVCIDKYQKVLDVLIHTNLERWYIRKSCDDYRDGMLLILKDAAQTCQIA